VKWGGCEDRDVSIPHSRYASLYVPISHPLLNQWCPPFPAAAYGADAAACYLPADVALSLRAEFRALGGSDCDCRQARYDV